MRQHQLSDSQDDPGDFGYLPPVRRRRVVLPVILFLLTCLSTFWVGVTRWEPSGPLMNLVSVLFSEESIVSQYMMDLRLLVVENWETGFIYMFAVLLILFAHEMGHFVATIIYKVPASYPFFLPFPLNPIGTLGAVIGMEGYIADRKQIFDIGIAGPLAGLVFAVPIAWLGVSQLDLTVQPQGWVGFRLPLVMQWFAESSQVAGYSPGKAVWLNQLNPLFVAGWVGMLITGINMFPIGQLDGGHVTYSLFGKAAHVIARATLALAIAYMVYHQSLIFVLMIFLLLLMGPDHPPTRDDRVKIGPVRWILGATSLAIPILCFPPLVFKINM
jgi:hypothetical protein